MLSYPREFRLPIRFDIHEMLGARDQLRLFLEELVQGNIPGDGIETYVRSLISAQRPRLDEWIPEGSWVLIPGPDYGCESDAKWDLYDSPSLYAVGILAVCSLRYPEIANKIPEIQNTIKKGMDFLAVRNFHGHGYDYESTGLDWMQIFHDGLIIAYVAKYPDLSPNFKQVLINRRKYYTTKLRKKDTKAGFGQDDYADEFKRVLPYFDLLK